MVDSDVKNPERVFAHDALLDHDWVARWRIPLIPHPYPSWRYEVALVVPVEQTPQTDVYGAVWPTEAEAAVIGDYIDFRRSWYRPGWSQKMLERPLDVDGGTNTVILLRRESGWHYRLDSWTLGPALWPLTAEQADALQAIAQRIPRPPAYGPDVAGLVSLIDKINEPGSRWAAWKTAHPDTYAATGTAA
jgi:hypothetical protein